MSVLRALNYFHKAKALWRHDQTKDGYILALLNISQLYSLIGNNFAAKYYALSAARHAATHTELHHRVSDAFGLILHSDFKQGAWISCLEDFRFYITSRTEFKTTDFNPEDQLLMKSLGNISMVLAISPRISTQLNGLVNYEKSKMNVIHDNLIEEYINEVNHSITDIDLPKVLQNTLDDSPLNDLGNQRKIRWDALGTEWTIIFLNDWLTNSVGEEFVAILQILITELGLSKLDLHLIRSKVEIRIEIGEIWVPPVREPSNDIHKWVIKLPAVIEEDYTKIKMQPSAILVSLKVILNEISLLPKDSLYGEIDNMLKKGDLAGKTLPDFIYQRLYRYLISEEHFDEPKRSNFHAADIIIKINSFDGLRWKSELSEKYNLDLSMELIRGRYEKALIPLHLTLTQLKKDDRYPEFLKKLKEKGWLDWQIVLALFNHTISYKVSLEMSGKTFPSKEIEQETVQKKIGRIMKIDEKDNYIAIPLEYYFNGDFDFQLKQVAMIVTGNWGLDGQKSEFPNFNAVKDFLIKRFNFDKDDDISLSPL